LADGRILYVLGILFVFFSLVMILMMFFSSGGAPLYPLFGLLNGLIAMGVGDIVIDLKHRKNTDKEVA
jgi:hypothetical protein